jgi:glutathione-regulated potassium-efflux system ancillary protein KefC
MATKFVGVYPSTISSLFGLTHHIIDQQQYSVLVAGVIGSAVIPTLIANAFFLPRYLLPQPAVDDEALAIAEFDEEATGHPKQLEQTG